MKRSGEAENRGPEGVDQSPEIRVVPDVRVTNSDDVNRSHDVVDPVASTALGSVSHFTGSEDEEEEALFRPFTRISYQRLLVREAEDKKKEEEKKNRVQEGRLVDGELKFDDQDGDGEEKLERDPNLNEGGTLPEYLAEEFPNEYIAKPIEEIDKNNRDKCFVVITKRIKDLNIYRFSATKSFFLFSPWNPWRRAMITVATNQFFDYFIICNILLNMAFLAMDQREFPWLQTAEYVFTAIYTFEMIVKLCARGFFVNKYTYLREPWNWIDFIVIVSAYITIILESTGGSGDFGSISALKTLRVFRALKTVSIIPGLKLIISALLRSMKMLIEVVFLKLFCMMVFALFALQVYLGVLRQICVKDLPYGVVLNDKDYMEYIKDSANWYTSNNKWIVCGNASGAGTCPKNHTCLPDVGENPNWGYTTFDNFGWAMLNAFQLITLDYWEDLYMVVIRASGPWNIIFFMAVVFFGSFYLVNMMLAVVNMSYEEEVNTNKREKERANRDMKESKKKRKDKKERDRAARKRQAYKGDSNHLQVMSAVNGSNAASSASLKSVGNGSAKLSTGSIRDDIWVGEGTKIGLRDQAKMVDESKQGKGKPGDSKNKKPATDGTAGKHESKENLVPNDNKKKNNKEGIDNPVIIADDTASISSEDSSGDPPVVKIKEEDEELSDRNCEGCSRCCFHYITWLRIQNAVYKVVSDLIFEIVITFCIVLNVVFMAMDHYDQPFALEETLRISNYIFTAIFTFEAVIKMIALSKQYFKSGWNIFDLIVVLASFVDLSVEGVGGLSALRAFRLMRLLRVFKLAQSWSTMRVLLSIIMRTLGALGNLTLVLFIVAYICAVIGMQLFGDSYTADKFAPDPIPRWNFSDFYHSLLLVFRILCGEWIEPLWDCMRARGEICMAVFLPTLFVGNLMVLNLFLALLINSFANDSLKTNKPKGDTKEESKVKQGWKRLKGMFKSKKKNAVNPDDDVRKSIASIVSELKKQKEDGKDDKDAVSNGKVPNNNDKDDLETGKKSSRSMDQAFQTDRNKYDKFHKALDKNKATGDSSKTSPNSLAPPNTKDEGKAKSAYEDDPEIKKKLEEGIAQDCFHQIFYDKCCSCCTTIQHTPTGVRWTAFRQALFNVTEHKAFEYFILVIILASSISLCFENIYLYRDLTMTAVLKYLNITYAIIFAIEMVLKLFALGLKKYFTSFWTILDFCIVIISFVSIAADQLGLDQLTAFRALRTLRAFRPLRAISRWQGMRIVVNALMHAIPAIFNVLLVCLVFWLIFSIAGVQLFAGKFFKCLDIDDNRIDSSIVPNRTVCEALKAQGQYVNWTNSDINFDTVFQGYLALLQVATFEGWIELMADAVDATEVGLQPRREATNANYLFFVIFIIFGSFFTLNLFIGVIIDNFNMLKKKYEGGYVDILLTQNQQNYYNTMKKLGNRKPQKTIKRPKNKVQGFFFDVSVSTKFELAIVILIFFNMVAMGVEHYKQSEAFGDALDIMNIIFTTIFTLEAIVKIIGMRWHYFRRGWNVFDFLIVVLSVIGVVLDDLLRQFFVTPSLLRVVRVFRIGRVLRLIKIAKGVRKLLFALMISLPALFNIFMLLFLIIFMYAIFGMALFGQVKPTGAMDDVTNFQTFGGSMLLLFRLTTAGGWNEILEPLMIGVPRCDPNYMTMPDTGELRAVPNGDCGTPGLAIFYMVTFLFITYMIIINMYIAVILENFNQAHAQEEVGITEDDFEMFYVVWERYDPHATQFIKYDQLSDFVADLDAPLGMPRPNEIALVAFDLPIYEGDRLHCLDILTSLVSHVLGSVEMTDEFQQLKSQVEEKYHAAFPTRVQQTVLSTTMRRKKEDVAAKTLQRAWRKHRAASNIRKITEMAMEMKRAQTRMSLAAAAERRPSQTPSVKPAPPPPPRPPSASSTNSIKAVNKAARVRQKSSLGNRRLMVPSATDISLPSDNNDLAL